MSYYGPDYPQVPPPQARPPVPTSPPVPPVPGRPPLADTLPYGAARPYQAGYYAPDGYDEVTPDTQLSAHAQAAGQAPYGYGSPATPYQQGPWGAPAPRKGLAIAALILGAVCLLTCWFLFVSIPAGLVGVVLGIVALVGAAKGVRGGKGMALTGLILSAVGLVATIVLLATLGLVMNWAADEAPTTPPPTATEPSAEESSPGGDETTSTNPTPIEVGQTQVDPVTDDTVSINSYFLGGPSPEDPDKNVLAVNLTLTQGETFLTAAVYAGAIKFVSSDGWEEFNGSYALDEDVAADLIEEYGLTGSAAAPWNTPRHDDGPIEGWVFYEVPADATGTWSASFVRKGFTVQGGPSDGAVVDEHEMVFDLG